MSVKLIKEGKKVRGFICKCKREHRFTGYVYAHWNDELTHTCDCGRKHFIENGTVVFDEASEPQDAPQRP